jgi:DNA-binding MarR family transcriptional regulator
VFALRLWERREIQLYSPQIALDILLHTTVATRRDQPAKIKHIHLAIGYSEDRVREIIKDLVANNFLELVRDQLDGRSKLVIPTAKTADILGKYIERARKTFAEPNKLQMAADKVQLCTCQNNALTSY